MDRAAVIKRELESFIKAHIPKATLTNFDDIVLSYVVDILEGVGEEESSFDVDQFTEMISAYVPEFAEVESCVICEWVFELVEKQQQRCREERNHTDIGAPAREASRTAVSTSLHAGTGDSDIPCRVENGAEVREGRETASGVIQSSRKERTRTTENNVSGNSEFQIHSVPPTSCDSGEDDEVSLLREMFPEVTEASLRATHQSCGGDMEMTIQRLLAVAEEHLKEQETDPAKRCPYRGREVKDDSELKELLLSRYAYVDAEEDKATHRPFLPKSESKKMIRYRDNQVVSTKGERFSLKSRKDSEGEEMKKTYVNLKPLRKYRFH